MKTNDYQHNDGFTSAACKPRRKLSIFVVLVVLSVGMLVSGVLICAEQKIYSYAAHQSQVQEVEGVNYNRFNAPQMLAVDEKYVYLIDRTDLEFNELTQRYEKTVFSIIVVNRENGHTVAAPVDLNLPNNEDSTLEINCPLYIKLESNGTRSYVFVFYYRWFMVFSASDLVAGKNNPIELDNNPFIAYKASLQTAPQYTPFFNVHYRSAAQGFMVIWGRANIYRYTHYTIAVSGSTSKVETSTAANSTSTQVLQPFIDEESIDGIVFDSKTNDFIIAFSNSGRKARFFRHKDGDGVPTLLNYELFPHVSSMNYIAEQNRLVFLSEELKQITWFNPTTGEFNSVELRTEKTFSTRVTDNPIFLSVFKNEVFVIDGNQSGSRKSIDQYHWEKSDGSETETLRFYRVVTATWGNDDGFYYSPSALTVIGDGQYIVADRSGQIAITNLNSKEVPKPFLQDTAAGTRDGDVISMVYDNFKHVYMFDSINGIRKFDLNGALVETYSLDSSGRSFGNITQLIAAPDQTIFALDSRQGQDRIYRYSGTAFVEIYSKPSRTFTISGETRGAVHDELNILVLTSVSVGSSKITTTINMNTPYTAVSSVSVSAINPGNSEVIMGIVFDISGNALTLVRKDYATAPSSYELRQFKLEQVSATSHAFALTAFDGTMEDIEVYTHNASLSLDKLNSRLYYIGAYHAIEYIDLQADLWSFKNRTGYDYTKDKSPWSHKDGQPSNFAKANKDTPIYDYPSALFANLPTASNIKIEKDGITKILEQTATFDAGKPGETVFSYRYVMYEARNRVHYGYVRINDIDFVEPYKVPGFVPENRIVDGIYQSGRVIYQNARIYQYPTADNSAVFGRIERNYNGLSETGTPGLQVTFVNVPDQRGRTYYEIQISPTVGENGIQLTDPIDGSPLFHPDTAGDFVGYVSRSVVIDYRLPPSENPFVANAAVSSASNGAQVYVFDGRAQYTPIEDEILSNGIQIYVVDPNELNKEYTYVKYTLKLGNAVIDLDGYIESRYITMNGISWVQIVSLTAIVIAVVLIIGLVIWRVKRGNR